MLLWVTVLLSLIAPLLSAPQIDNFSDGSNVKIFVKPTTEQSTDKKFNQNAEGQAREGENQNSNFAVIDEGLEIGSSRQNFDAPISLDDDYEVSNVNPAFPAASFPNPTADLDGSQGALPVFQGDPSSFSGGDQDVFPPFGSGPSNFPQQQFGLPPAPSNQFPPQPSFGNQPPPFAFQQQQPQRPFFSFQQPEAPEGEDDASEKNEEDGKKRVSFLQSLFTF